MSILYNGNIPLSTNSPSVDQPNMQTNTNSIATYVAVDHIGFNSGAGQNSGQHKQVTFNVKTSQGPQTDPNSVLYTANGTASAVADLYYANQTLTHLISCIKAFGSMSAGASPAFLNQYNCNPSITVSGNNYSVTLSPANIIPSSSSIVCLITFSTITTGGALGWSFNSSTNVLTILNAALQPNTTTINFIILQA